MSLWYYDILTVNDTSWDAPKKTACVNLDLNTIVSLSNYVLLAIIGWMILDIFTYGILDYAGVHIAELKSKK
jgi:hypothetical protein